MRKRPGTERERLIQVAIHHMIDKGYYSTLPTQEAIDYTRRTAAAYTIDALIQSGAIRVPLEEIPCRACGYTTGHHPDCRVEELVATIDAHRPAAPNDPDPFTARR